MKITNKFGLPDVFLKAAHNDTYNPGPSDITVTKLISPPRIVELERRYQNELEIDISDRVFLLLGKAVHAMLEQADKHSVTEERLYIERCGWVMSGAFDRLAVNDGLLQDYKVSTVASLKDGGRIEHIQQLNLLAHLCREHGVEVTRLEIVYVLRDWSKAGAERNHGYPKAAVETVSAPIWTTEKCEEFIYERVRLHQAARERLPMCTPTERWATPDAWAVRKAGRERAVRVLDSEEEAVALAASLGEGHSVEKRPGRNVRCEGYCSVLHICKQITQEVEDNSDIRQRSAK